MWRFLALPLCLLATACGAAPHNDHTIPTDPAQRRSQRPDEANYNTIVIAIKLRDQALHLKAWNQKAYAAELGLLTLVTLEHTMPPATCASFVAHLYAELLDLHDAYPGENWRPMFVVVAHDPTVASQCRSARPATSSKPRAKIQSMLESSGPFPSTKLTRASERRFASTATRITQHHRTRAISSLAAAGGPTERRSTTTYIAQSVGSGDEPIGAALRT